MSMKLMLSGIFVFLLTDYGKYNGDQALAVGTYSSSGRDCFIRLGRDCIDQQRDFL